MSDLFTLSLLDVLLVPLNRIHGYLSLRLLLDGSGGLHDAYLRTTFLGVFSGKYYVWTVLVLLRLDDGTRVLLLVKTLIVQLGDDLRQQLSRTELLMLLLAAVTMMVTGRFGRASWPIELKFLLEPLEHAVEVGKNGQTGHLLAVLRTNLPQTNYLGAPSAHLTVGKHSAHCRKLREVEAEVFSDLPERLHIETGHHFDYLRLVLEHNLLQLNFLLHGLHIVDQLQLGQVRQIVVPSFRGTLISIIAVGTAVFDFLVGNGG